MDDLFGAVNALADKATATLSGLAGNYLDLQKVKTNAELQRYALDRQLSQPWGLQAGYLPAGYTATGYVQPQVTGQTIPTTYLLIGGGVLLAVVLLARR